MSQTTTFADFLFPKPLNDAIKRMGFETPTPVQSQAIPLLIKGKDVISLAETGSGKTAAYLIPMVARTLIDVDLKSKKQVLVLAPTRELAVQISEVVRSLTLFTPSISSAILIGGGSMDRQIAALRRIPRFVVATPGRLMDHARRRFVDLKNFDTLILDEADRMFDMGFAPQVKEIVQYMTKERQTMLFSATFPKEIRELASRILVNPVDIAIQKNIVAPPQIVQKAIECTTEAKNDKTFELVSAATGAVLVFAKTKRRTDKLNNFLAELGVSVARIHGDRSQSQRNMALQGFRNGQYKVLVATDIAARGIDVSSVSDVINYDLPESYEDYVHRIGRTGRAGREGIAQSLVTSQDRGKWTMLARKIGMALPSSFPAGGYREEAGPSRQQRGGGGGRNQQQRRFGGGGGGNGGGGPKRQWGNGEGRSENRGESRGGNGGARPQGNRPANGQAANPQGNGNGYGQGKSFGNGHKPRPSQAQRSRQGGSAGSSAPQRPNHSNAW